MRNCRSVITTLPVACTRYDSDELLEIYLTALTTSFDPHTSYMSTHTLENFEIEMRSATGRHRRRPDAGDDGYTVVTKVIPGGAADKDGRLKADDKVIGVGQGAEGPIEDVVDMKLSDVVQKIRGRRGTIVRLEVIPNGTSREASLRHHPRRNRADRQRSPRPDHRRDQGCGQTYQDRRDRPAQLLHGHGRRPPAICPTSRAPPATCAACSRISSPRAWRPWCSTCAERRRLADRSHQPDRPVHRRRTGRAGEGRRRSRPAVRRPGARRGLGRSAGGADQQVQRQRQRDLRRRHSGLSTAA